jgi:hypothetical protein
MHWAHQVMHELDYYPSPCEVKAFMAAAVEACDELDGIADGVISSDEYAFNPFTLVSQTFDCDGTDTAFTKNGASVMEVAWEGPCSADGEFQWYGYHPDADIQSKVASTTCSTPENYTTLVKAGIQRYDSIIGTRDADLTPFRDSGGKMITWHGLADGLIPFPGSTDYHDRVRAIDETVDDYFRLFLAPGTAHCVSGKGHYPVDVISELVNWVERRNAPTQLVAQDMTNVDPATGILAKGDPAERGRPLCVYPRVQKYLGGDPDLQSSFECAKE